MIYKSLDLRNFFIGSFNNKVVTADDNMSCYYHLKRGSRKFGIPTVFHWQLQTIAQNDERLSNIFTEGFSTDIVYTIHIKNALVSPRPIGIPRYWAIFGKTHYVYNIINQQAKIKLDKDKIIEYNQTNEEIAIPRNTKFEKINEKCVFLYFFNNIDHTFRETLPALLTLQEMGIDLKKIKYFTNKDYIKYLPILELFGIDKEQMIVGENQWYKIKELFVPSFITLSHVHTPTIYYDRLSYSLQEKIAEYGVTPPPHYRAT